MLIVTVSTPSIFKESCSFDMHVVFLITEIVNRGKIGMNKNKYDVTALQAGGC